MSDIGSRYAAGRRRITELVGDLGPRESGAPVPACPGWTVKDVVAHLAGVCADILSGNLAGVATDPWTQAHVEARRDRSLPDILAEWEEAGSACEALASAFPPDAGEQWLADLVTHEHDIRGALGRPGARDDVAVAAALTWMAGRLDGFSREGSLPSLRLLTHEGEDVVIGEPPARGTLRAGRFDVLRAITGRRSRAQIASFDWDGDPEEFSYLFCSGPFRIAERDIPE